MTTVSEVDLYRYELPLTAPLRGESSVVQHRRGLLVRVGTADGQVGWGEAAPLPGFSPETLADVVAHAQSVVSRWPHTAMPSPEGSLASLLRALPCGDDCPASFRFAVESAVADLLASTDGASLPAILGAPRKTVDLNALIVDPSEEGSGQAAWFREAGYRAVKVKVGRASVPEEAAWVRAVRRELGETVALRLDANRAWSLETALEFAEAIRDVDVQYLEEPLASPSRLDALASRTDLPLALDETTREVEPDVLSNLGSVAAVVLKPTLLGGVLTTRRWMRAAQDCGVTPVLSAAYESGVGLRMLVALAATGPDTPVGLSTYDRLAADVLSPRLRLQGPSIEVGAVTAPPLQVDDTHLAAVPQVD